MFHRGARDKTRMARRFIMCVGHVKAVTARSPFQEPHINGPERVITDSGDAIVLGTTSGRRRPNVEEA